MHPTLDPVRSTSEESTPISTIQSHRRAPDDTGARLRSTVRFTYFAILLGLGAASSFPQEPPDGAYYSTSATPTDPKLRSADYVLWIPQGVDPLRGVLMRQHGCGAQTWKIGLNHARDLQWQALARRHRLALMASRLVATEDCDAWSDVGRGSDRLFLQAIRQLAELSGRPELVHAPWVLWGHSGGAKWSSGMLLKYPSRVAAAVLARCGETGGENREAAQVPVLWTPGANDHLSHCVSTPQRSFDEYRARGAYWALALDPSAGHELAAHRSLAIPYLDAVLTQRLGGNGLRPMDEARAWLGDTATGAIAPALQFRGVAREAAWLPDEETARRWREFVATGAVSPRGPLPRVAHLRADPVSATGVEVSWTAAADLEHGMPSFAVFRDGAVIGGVPGQSHGYHDDPAPLEVRLRYHDAGLRAGETHRYRAAPLSAWSASPQTPATPSAEAVLHRTADLTAERLSWSNGPEVVIVNRGTASTPAGLPIEALFRIDGEDLGRGEIAGPLAAGASATCRPARLERKPPAAGRRRLEILIDYRNRIVEPDEENNSLAAWVEIPIPAPR